MKNNICCIFNLAPHYNAPIYSLMDRELGCDFYIGDKVPYSIKLMDYSSLNGFKKALKNTTIIGNFYYQKGAISLAFKPYKQYILTGEPYCISTWFALIINKITGKKSYLWSHGWYGNESHAKKIMKKIFFSLTTKVFLYGDYAKKLMIQEGFKQDKLIPIYNSLDYENQILIRKKLTFTSIYVDHFSNTFPILLYIGRIQSRKKIELLIEALYELHKSKTYCNLIIIGKLDEDSNINNLVSMYGLEKFVWFYGACYEERLLGELIFNADVCVVPGDIGLTAMHSFVYGLPVVTHNNFQNHGPEFEAVMPGITGDFFLEDSIQDLCLKIKDSVNIGSKKREEIRENCYEIIDLKYNPNKQIDILKKALY